MIYAAFFSFAHDGKEPKNGDFTCLVEAPDADTASERLYALIEKSIEDEDQFAEDTDIYLEQLTEVGKIPKDGAIVHYRSVSGEPEPTLYGSLVFPRKLTGWAVYSAVDPNGEDTSMAPFYTVPPKAMKAKAKAKAKVKTPAKPKAKAKAPAKAKAKAPAKPKATAKARKSSRR